MAQSATVKREEKSTTSNRGYMHYLIALIIGVVMALVLQPTNGLTEKGVMVIAVIIPTLYLWLTTNTHWTSILFLGLLVMTRVMTPNEVWAGSMGHFSVITLIVFMILNVCLKETGVIDKIAIWFITRKFVQGRPYAFMAMFFASNVIVGMFMENLSLAVIYVGIATVLCEKIGVKKGDPFYTTIFMGTLWGNCILSIASPIAHALPNILMGIAQTQLGFTITYGMWLAVGVPFAIIMFVVLMICARAMNPDTSAFRNFDLEEMKRSSPPLDVRGKITAVAMILVILTILLPEILRNVFPTVCGYLTSIGVVVPAILALAALCIIRVEGKPVMDLPTAARGVPLPVIIFTGTVCVMSTPISSEATGISVWLTNILNPVVAGLSPMAIVIVLIIGSLIMTNFLSNTVTMVLFFNLGAALLAGGNLNMGAITIVIGLAGSMACLTPSAAIPSPLYFGPGHVTMGNTIKYNLIFIVLSFVVLVAFALPFASAIIHV